MQLHPGEPAVPDWERVSDADLALRLRRLLPGGDGLVLVDGRSGGGKTTWASRIARLLDSPVVHSDDVSWHHDPFDWDQLLLDHVIDPWRRGERVDFVPPGWPAHGRSGAIQVRPSPTLVIEGVGVCRVSLADLADLPVWVQSDAAVARRLGIARDAEQGRVGQEAVDFWDWWMGVEDPFQAAERPWTRARLVLRGACAEPLVPGVAMIAPGPL